MISHLGMAIADGENEKPKSGLSEEREAFPQLSPAVPKIRKKQQRQVQAVLEGNDPQDPAEIILSQYQDAAAALDYLDQSLTKRTGFPSKEDIKAMLAGLDRITLEKLKKIQNPVLLIVPPISMQELEWSFENPSTDRKVKIRLDNGGASSSSRKGFEICIADGTTIPDIPEQKRLAKQGKKSSLKSVMAERSRIQKQGFESIEADEFALLSLQGTLLAMKEYEEDSGVENEKFEYSSPFDLDYVLNADYLAGNEKRISVGRTTGTTIQLERLDSKAAAIRPLVCLPVIRLNRNRARK